MSQGRKIVTAVVSVLTLGLMACTGQMRALRRGETNLGEMQRIKAELADAYLITLAADVEKNEARAKTLDPAARARVRSLLERFVRLTTDVLRLDDQKGVAVTGRAGIEAERDHARHVLDVIADADPAPTRS